MQHMPSSPRCEQLPVGIPQLGRPSLAEAPDEFPSRLFPCRFCQDLREAPSLLHSFLTTFGFCREFVRRKPPDKVPTMPAENTGVPACCQISVRRSNKLKATPVVASRGRFPDKVKTELGKCAAEVAAEYPRRGNLLRLLPQLGVGDRPGGEVLCTQGDGRGFALEVSLCAAPWPPAAQRYRRRSWWLFRAVTTTAPAAPAQCGGDPGDHVVHQARSG